MRTGLRGEFDLCSLGGFLALAAFVLWTPAGCASRVGPISAWPVRRQAALRSLDSYPYDRTSTTFDWGGFYKPREGSMAGLEAELAPLIVQQVPGENTQDVEAQRFGELRTGPDGNSFVDNAHPTVYAHSRMVTYKEATYPQLRFTWYYPSGGAHEPGLIGPAVALSITLGADGFPLLSEIRHVPQVGPYTHILFVSESLERRAAEAFGEPLPGRRYAIERGVQDTPQVLVAGLVEDGPIPMGPYVYLDADSHRVTTVLCRCSPSQVDALLETTYYDLLPSDTLPAGVFDFGTRASETKPGEFLLPQVLRWPG